MTTFTSEDRMAVEKTEVQRLKDQLALLDSENKSLTDENNAMKEQSYQLAIKVVNRQIIPWPENADSILWNDRIVSLLNALCIEFGIPISDGVRNVDSL
jgi:hypothetical protein